jgi:predicted transcriptional regulator
VKNYSALKRLTQNISEFSFGQGINLQRVGESLNILSKKFIITPSRDTATAEKYTMID